MEIWKDVKGYEGLYQVSDKGRVKSEDRWVNNKGTLEFRKGRILKENDNRGYKLVCLSNGGKTFKAKVHRLVAEAFVPNPDNKPEVDHISGDKGDNRACNLRWCSKAENMKNPHTVKKLSDNHSKPVYMVCADGTVMVFKSLVECSEQTSITRDTLYRSLSGKELTNYDFKMGRVCYS